MKEEKKQKVNAKAIEVEESTRRQQSLAASKCARRKKQEGGKAHLAILERERKKMKRERKEVQQRSWKKK